LVADACWYHVAQTVFDEHGSLKDEAIKMQLEKFLNGFVEFIQK